MRLLGALEGRYELIAFRGRPNIPFDAVDVTIRAHLRAGGLDHPSRSVTELLAERARSGVKLALAIDDAHLLLGDSIQQLLRMRATILETERWGLRLILVGDQSLSRGRLPLPDPVDDSQVVRLNLRPFNLEQAGAYLRHRLRVAGIEDPETFLNSGDIAVLQTSAKGLPAALNAQANAWLARRCRSAGGLKQAVTGKRGGLAAASAAPDVGRREASGVVSAGNDLEPPAGVMDLDLELEPDTYQPARERLDDPQLAEFLVAEGESSDSGDFEQILQRVREHQQRQGQGVQPVPEPKAATRAELQASVPREPYWNRRWFIPAILIGVFLAILVPVAWQFWFGPDRVPASETVEPDVAAEDAPPDAEDRAASDSPSDGPPAETEPVGPDEPLPEPPPPLEAAPEQSAATAVAGSPPSPAEGESASGAQLAALAEDLDWLMRQEPERFTIQLVAARDLATSRGFVEPHGLEGIHYIQTRAYVIAVLGSFPNRGQAAQFLPSLPAAVRDNGPWIRTIGSIRESLP
jgi:DamX protein